MRWIWSPVSAGRLRPRTRQMRNHACRDRSFSRLCHRRIRRSRRRRIRRFSRLRLRQARLRWRCSNGTRRSTALRTAGRSGAGTKPFRSLVTVPSPSCSRNYRRPRFSPFTVQYDDIQGQRCKPMPSQTLQWVDRAFSKTSALADRTYSPEEQGHEAA
jgi:hypothetical protein